MSEEKIYPSMVIRSQAEAIELLKQENQQLKEQLKDENNYHNEAVKWYKEAFDIEQERIKYKSVLDEIREYIKEHLTDNGRFLMLNEWQVPELLQILDKVNINPNDMTKMFENCTTLEYIDKVKE